MAFNSSIVRDAPFAKNAQARTGNRIKILIAGAEVGAIQSLDPSDDYAPEPVSGIGDIHVIEYAPSMARHTLSVETMVLSRNSLQQLGISLENGDDALRGVTFDIVITGEKPPVTQTGQANQNNFSPDINQGVVAPLDALRTYTGCSIASGSMQIRKHAIIVSNAQINALDVKGNSL